MAVDYEAEYNNRARVPEHPEIFARWKRDAAAYRERMKAEENAELGLAYGTERAPDTSTCSSPTRPATPRSRCSSMAATGARSNPSTFSHMSAGLNARGIAVAVAGYDLCPQVTIVQIIDQIRTACLFLWRRFGQRLMVYGHSAGGHLAACMVATDWKKLDPKAPLDLVPAGYSISGLFDLKPLIATAMNADFKLNEAERRAGLAAVVAGAARARVRRGGRRRGVEPNSCARAASSRTTGASAASRRATRKCPARTISPWSIRLSDPSSAMTARCAALAARCAKVDK